MFLVVENNEFVCVFAEMCVRILEALPYLL